MFVKESKIVSHQTSELSSVCPIVIGTLNDIARFVMRFYYIEANHRLMDMFVVLIIFKWNHWWIEVFPSQQGNCRNIMEEMRRNEEEWAEGRRNWCLHDLGKIWWRYSLCHEQIIIIIVENWETLEHEQRYIETNHFWTVGDGKPGIWEMSD